MKRTSSTKTPVTSDDAPKLAQKDFDKARFRVGGKAASRAEWQAATRARVGKLRINIMLDAPIVEHFKALAGERGYQSTYFREGMVQRLMRLRSDDFELLSGLVHAVAPLRWLPR